MSTQGIDHEAPKKLDLASSTLHWRNRACLNRFRNPGWHYAEGYRLLAEIGAYHVIEKHRDQDTLVFPIMNNYRHYVELACKEIIGMNRWLHNEPYKDDITHSLSRLWNLARPIIMELFNGQEGDIEIVQADLLIAQLDEWDKGGTSFRYKNDAYTHKNSLPNVDHIAIDTVKLKMDELHTILYGADCELGQRLDKAGKGW